MSGRTFECSACGASVPYGRLSCPECGELLASVAGGRRTEVDIEPSTRSAEVLDAAEAVEAPEVAEVAEAYEADEPPEADDAAIPAPLTAPGPATLGVPPDLPGTYLPPAAGAYVPP